MKKSITILLIFSMLFWTTAPVMAMGSKMPNPSSEVKSSPNSGGSQSSDGGGIVEKVNEIGNSDGYQQAVGDIGTAVAKGGQSLANDGWDRALNQGATPENANKIIKNGTKIFTAGKILEKTAKVAPHVGWVATSAGYASEGQYKGAAIQAVNGATRTVTVAKVGTVVGTAGGIWVAGKLGAVAGSWAGPLGAGAGFIIGVGAAWVGGKIWDKTVGKGAEALTQKAADWDSQNQYGSTRGGGRSSGGGGGGDWGRDDARDNVRTSVPRPPMPTGSGSGSGGSRPPGCTCTR